jgi:hypothetical protein
VSGLSRRDFEELWERVDADAQAAKFSQGALLRLMAFYRGLDADDQHTVNEALAVWVTQGDERRKFDALALVEEFKIRSATPALHQQLDRLTRSADPSAPYDRAWIERIMTDSEATRDQ